MVGLHPVIGQLRGAHPVVGSTMSGRADLTGSRGGCWLAAGCACGALVGLSIPPFGWWPLAWLGFAGLALPPARTPSRIRALVGFGGRARPVRHRIVVGARVLDPRGCMALMVLERAVRRSALAAGAERARRRVGGRRAAGGLVLADWLRDRFPLGGFPLGGMSLGQAASPLRRPSGWAASLLLTGETVLVGVALAELVRAGRAWRVPARRGPPADGAGGTALRVRGRVRRAVGRRPSSFRSLGSLSPSGAGRPPERRIRVALVQGGGPRGTRAIDTDPDRGLRPPPGGQPVASAAARPGGVAGRDAAEPRPRSPPRRSVGSRRSGHRPRRHRAGRRRAGRRRPATTSTRSWPGVPTARSSATT